MTGVGRITFGPRQANDGRHGYDQAIFRAGRRRIALPVDRLEDMAPRVCCCVGPQPGETKCPCHLRAESAKGYRMIQDGIVIDGIEYDLVPKRRKR